ncbi:MAG: 4-hydroxythreonine-4-phosphate dehydrogenase PdxA [Candidatus Omnitrophica bacterium]|jgi:4-hydroxythreonine-4-phosphate dehydrogenase|nr:4-hydroxythreonine-4-phosphate dehydrogenase PdxA [Candidatus Omnitrophota bacterium]
MSDKKVKVGITLGDPAGIGMEITLKALNDKSIRESASFLLIGDYGAVTHAQRLLNMKSFNFHILSDIGRLHMSDELINFINLGNITYPIPYGKVDERCGKAAYEYINMACLVLRSQNSLDALVTAPINKESMNLAGYHFQGHTQILAQRFKAPYVRMMFVAEKLKVVLVTIHTALKNVPELVTRKEVQDTIFAVHRMMNTFFKVKRPRIAVCGLNPHASEDGLFGTEEKEQIIPAIKKARSQKVNVEGPFPADSLFWKAKNGGYDVIVAMYHDQACIPIKTLYFDKGVNVTLGLPFVRTSPDHGTAFDIAGKNIADPNAMKQAIRLAVEMASNMPRKRKKKKVYVPHTEHAG